MTFQHPDLLWLAVVLPAIATLAIVGYYRRRRRAARTLGDLGLISRIGGAGLEEFPTRRLLLIAPAALCLGLAAAGPQWGSRSVETHGRSLDLVLILDVSKSMLARDLEPSRLERQRLFATRLIRELAGDRIGLVAFAGRAYVISPLTTDHSALQLYIDALDPGIVSHGGSSLAAAITRGVELFRGATPSANRDRVLVLLTDGEALEEESAVREAVRRAEGQGIIIHAVGIGTTAGAPVPDLDPAGYTIGYKRDPDTGETVVSRLDETLLQLAARTTRGHYVRGDRAGATDALVARIKGLERAATDDGTREVPHERFAWFIALALALIALDAVLARRAPAAPRDSRPGHGPTTTSHTDRRAHSGTTTAAAFVLLVAVTAFGIGDIERGNRLYREGRYAEAVDAYRAALRDGNDSPTLHYNLGTALLRLGHYQEAEEHLRAALAGRDSVARQRTLYNLGNRFLEEGTELDDPAARGQALEAAASAYRDALRLDPNDRDAKWNLELTRRELEKEPPSASGGQQQQQQRQPGQDQQRGQGDQNQQPGSMMPPNSTQNSSPDLSDAPGQMTREEADRILGAIEQAERELQRAKLRKGRRDTPVARDW